MHRWSQCTPSPDGQPGMTDKHHGNSATIRSTNASHAKISTLHSLHSQAQFIFINIRALQRQRLRPWWLVNVFPEVLIGLFPPQNHCQTRQSLVFGGMSPDCLGVEAIAYQFVRRTRETWTDGSWMSLSDVVIYKAAHVWLRGNLATSKLRITAVQAISRGA